MEILWWNPNIKRTELLILVINLEILKIGKKKARWSIFSLNAAKKLTRKMFK